MPGDGQDAQGLGQGLMQRAGAGRHARAGGRRGHRRPRQDEDDALFRRCRLGQHPRGARGVSISRSSPTAISSPRRTPCAAKARTGADAADAGPDDVRRPVGLLRRLQAALRRRGPCRSCRRLPSGSRRRCGSSRLAVRRTRASTSPAWRPESISRGICAAWRTADIIKRKFPRSPPWTRSSRSQEGYREI